MSNILFSVRSDKNVHLPILTKCILANYESAKNGIGYIGKTRFNESISISKVNGYYDVNNEVSKVSIFDTSFIYFNSSSVYDINSNIDAVAPNTFLNAFYLLMEGTIVNGLKLAETYQFTIPVSDYDLVSKMITMYYKSTGDMKIALTKVLEELEGSFAIVLYKIGKECYIVQHNRSLNISYCLNEFLFVSTELPDTMSTCTFQSLQSDMVYVYSIKVIKYLYNFAVTVPVTNMLLASYKPKTRTALVLASGGMNSSVLAKQLKDSNEYDFVRMLNLGCSNNQLYHKQVVREFARTYHMEYDFIDIRSNFSAFNTNAINATDIKFEQLSDINFTYVSSKMIMLLTTALGYAESNNITDIYVGNTNDIFDRYFNDSVIDKFNQLCNTTGLLNVKFIEPFKHYSKFNVFDKILINKIPFNKFVDCNNSIALKDNDTIPNDIIDKAKNNEMNYIPCGTCLGCTIRRHMFRYYDWDDPFEQFYIHPISMKFPNYYKDHLPILLT